MRKLLTGLFMLGALAVANQAQAAVGTVDMSWDVCAPIVVDKTSAVQGEHGLNVSILGHDEAHRGYNVWGIVGTAARTTPDAWAFDGPGCQGAALVTLLHLPPALLSKACPAFMGTATGTQVKFYDQGQSSGGLDYDPNLRRFLVGNAYTTTVTATAGTRYFLIQVLFNHTFSVVGAGQPGLTCGGFENAMCFTLLPYKLQFLDANGLEQNLNQTSGQHFATFNNAGNPMGCPAVPAVNKTWGQIKSQYRN